MIWSSDECPDDIHEGSATINETSYVIQSLREGTSYSFVITATNSTGTISIPSNSITGETKEQGECMTVEPRL